MTPPLESGAFAQTWRVDILKTPPLIAPARQFTYPQSIAGEEDALARGALRILIHPAAGGNYLASCALGFKDPSMPSGIHACPNADYICMMAGGYAYLSDTLDPGSCTLLGTKPVVDVHPLPTHGLLLFAGFHTLAAWKQDGLAWQTSRLSWEGVRLSQIVDDQLHGFGWNMLSDKEVAFTVDLKTGIHTGGGYAPVPSS